MSGLDQCIIRAARPSDAVDIFDIKQRAFANSTLPYTIYRASAAVHYLEKIIQETNNLSSSYVTVAEAQGRVVGYYLGSLQPAVLFLNYIAVDDAWQGYGVGKALLAHFEACGRVLGCAKLALDAVQDNLSVLDWYVSHGFSSTGTYMHVRLPMVDSGRTPWHLEWEETAWEEAINREQVWGFSRLPVVARKNQLELGLIDGTVCKLLDWGKLDICKTIDAIMARLSETRKELVISNLRQAPEGLVCWQSLIVERLVKELK